MATAGTISLGEELAPQRPRNIVNLDECLPESSLAEGNGCRSSASLPQNHFVSRSISEVSELLRRVGHANERALLELYHAHDRVVSEHNERALAMQREVEALREQLAAHGITAMEPDKWHASRHHHAASDRGSQAFVVETSEVSLDVGTSTKNGTAAPVEGRRVTLDMRSSRNSNNSRNDERSHSEDAQNGQLVLDPTLDYPRASLGGLTFSPGQFDQEVSRASYGNRTSGSGSSEVHRLLSSRPATAIINPELHLRSPWTVHQEMDNADNVMMLTKCNLPQEQEEMQKRPTMRDTIRMNVQKIKVSKLRQMKFKCSSMIAAPGANWRLAWDLSGAMLIGYDVIMIPFDLSFMPPENGFLTFMDWLTMIFWTSDMILTFFVGYIDRGRLVMNPVAIARRYMMTWFILDALVVAGDWFNNVGSASSGSGGSISGFGKMVRSLRAIRVLRLLRLLKLRRMMAELQDHISSEYTYLLLSLTKLLLFILFLNHGIACLWYWLGRRGHEEMRPSWVGKNLMSDKELGYKYTTSLHWTLTQFTPASMEVMPQNTEERTMSVIVLMFALVAFSSFVGSISTSMTALRNMNADTNKQFWMLRRFLKQQSVTKQVGRRILKYLEYIVEKKQGKVQQNAIKILGMLSGQLQEELTYELTCPHLMQSAFFQYYLGFPHMDVVVRKICMVAMKKLTVATADVLFYPGDEAAQVYCFLAGDVVIAEEEQVIEPPVQELEWISEIALWTPWKHTSTCQANQESDIISVNINKFIEECSRSVVSWSLAAKYGKQILQVVQQLNTPPGDLVRHERVKQRMEMFCVNERQSFFVTSSPTASTTSQTAFRNFGMVHTGTRTQKDVMTQRMSTMLKQKEGPYA